MILLGLEGILFLKMPGKYALIKVHVNPNAKKTAVVGMHGDAVKIWIAEPPVKGRANKELLKFIAKKLNISKEYVSIRSGSSSRKKTVAVQGIRTEDAMKKLLDNE